MRAVLSFLLVIPALVFANTHQKHPLEVYTDAELEVEENAIEQMSKAVIAPISTSSKKRDQHPKDNGCVDNVRVVVRSDLPADLQVGIFQAGAEYEAVARSSSAKPDPNHDDRIPSGQGLFLKILFTGKNEALQKDVNRLQPWQKHYKSVDKKYYLSQDIITITEGRATYEEGKPNPFVNDFFANKPMDYQDFFKAQGKAAALGKELGGLLQEIGKAGLSADEIVARSEAILAKFPVKPEVVKQVSEAIVATKTFPATQIEPLAQAVFAATYFFDAKGTLKRPLEAVILKKLGAMAVTDPLTEAYHSFTASAYGEKAAVKYLIHPETEQGLTVPFPEGVNRDDKNYLREVLKARLRAGEIRYTLSVQFYDTTTSPNVIEDAAQPWKTKALENPKNVWQKRGFVPLATVIFPKKEVGKELMDSNTCENLPSSPGRGLAAHRGIGGVQRARDIIYPLVQNARMEAKGEIEIEGDL